METVSRATPALRCQSVLDGPAPLAPAHVEGAGLLPYSPGGPAFSSEPRLFVAETGHLLPEGQLLPPRAIDALRRA